MKVLYCNPIALDYRLPFYKKMVTLFDGEFYFLYSENRYKLSGREALLEKIHNILGRNAIAYTEEKIFNTSTLSFTHYSSENGKRIPFPFGLYRQVKTIKPDVLITEGFFQWTPLLVWYARMHRIPLFVGYERTMWTERKVKWWKKIQRKLIDKCVRGYLVNGSETKKYLMSLGINEEKIHIGGMSADSEGLKQAVASMDTLEQKRFRSMYTNDDGLLYLFCGQIVKRKGVGYLLEAWKEHIKGHPQDSLVIVGKGDLLEGYKRDYKDYDSIHFEGAVPYSDVYKYYAVADVFVIPTLEDNWSLVVPEAMACGLPVATSIYNGCHVELIEEGVNGYTFDTLQKECIIEVLDKFHHVDLKAFGEVSIRLEEPWNTENCARREYEGIMKGLGVK